KKSTKPKGNWIKQKKLGSRSRNTWKSNRHLTPSLSCWARSACSRAWDNSSCRFQISNRKPRGVTKRRSTKIAANIELNGATAKRSGRASPTTTHSPTRSASHNHEASPAVRIQERQSARSDLHLAGPSFSRCSDQRTNFQRRCV